MALINARASDWRPGNPTSQPGKWILPVLIIALIMIAIIALAGSLSNGDGSPYLCMS